MTAAFTTDKNIIADGIGVTSHSRPYMKGLKMCKTCGCSSGKKAKTKTKAKKTKTKKK